MAGQSEILAAIGNLSAPEPVEHMPPDFGMARFYLDRARNAHQAGNVVEFVAARSMLMIALGGKP